MYNSWYEKTETKPVDRLPSPFRLYALDWWKVHDLLVESNHLLRSYLAGHLLRMRATIIVLIIGR